MWFIFILNEHIGHFDFKFKWLVIQFSQKTISLKKSLGLGRILDILDVKFQTYEEIESLQ